MYLIHNTNICFLKSILIENKLKASYLTGNINEGDGCYESKNQKFVFFSVIDEYDSKYEIYGDVILYFDSKILWNRSYYISTVHSAFPYILGKWNKGKIIRRNTNNIINIQIRF